MRSNWQGACWAAPDSRNPLPALLGDSPEGREELVEQSASGRLSLREGAWKHIPAGEAGTHPGGEGDAEKPAQLHDLATDPGETRNFAPEPRHLERAASMRGRLDAPRAGWPR